MNTPVLTGTITPPKEQLRGTVVAEQPLSGTLSSDSSIVGTVNQESSLVGKASSQAQLVGSASNTNGIVGTMFASPGIPGRDGGYYYPDIVRVDDSTVKISFIPSKDYMESVEPILLNIPSSGNNENHVTEEWLEQKGFAKKSDIPTDYLKEIPTEYVTEQELYAKDYALKTDIPSVPQWSMQPHKPTYTANEVEADPKGTAEIKVTEHNVDTIAHNDIRVLLAELTNRLNALADSDDTTLDQMSEIVAYIKSNKGLIEAVTTEKVSYSDIINDLVTNLENKPLSASQGVALKALIDAIKVPVKISELDNDKGYLTEHQSLKDYALKTEIPTVPKNVSAFNNDVGYLTEHQDISGKLDASRLPEAINTALSQAKESGEFDGYTPIKGIDYVDGKDGYTPVKGTDYWTLDDIQKMVADAVSGVLGKKSTILETAYPIGAIYMSTIDTDPKVLFGFGTWERIQDRFLLAAGNTYAAGTTGGEATHTLTTDEMPSHSHGAKGWAAVVDGSGKYVTLGGSGSSNQYATREAGGGQAHNNMPPYLAVYVWKRTA